MDLKLAHARPITRNRASSDSARLPIRTMDLRSRLPRSLLSLGSGQAAPIPFRALKQRDGCIY